MTDRITCFEDYQRIRRSFRWERPDYFNFGFDVVDRWAAERPDATALHLASDFGEAKVRFAETSERSSRFAQALLDLGLKRGDRVLVMMPRYVEWWETMIGLFKAGLVAMPGTTLLTTKDIDYRLRVAEV
ncbi:MAG: AMP-binding protein, partial [Planctomycetaceae bacterium]|nr:AMP-binding protein [Planctomycetaceae bacterium]